MKPLALALALILITSAGLPAQPPAVPAVHIATFDVDATPPIGTAMAYDPVRRLDELTLRCR